MYMYLKTSSAFAFSKSTKGEDGGVVDVADAADAAGVSGASVLGVGASDEPPGSGAEIG